MIAHKGEGIEPKLVYIIIGYKCIGVMLVEEIGA
jgi:hypothetical protein